ncbi:hypothetical protein DFJ73DRAFT_137889 [Zopfochytrium polystomum]|nr:hypothetical protein DFJ73DRAFT_137889 [Zopfochytrium polystomum]
MAEQQRAQQRLPQLCWSRPRLPPYRPLRRATVHPKAILTRSSSSGCPFRSTRPQQTQPRRTPPPPPPRPPCHPGPLWLSCRARLRWMRSHRPQNVNAPTCPHLVFDQTVPPLPSLDAEPKSGVDAGDHEQPNTTYHSSVPIPFVYAVTSGKSTATPKNGSSAFSVFVHCVKESPDSTTLFELKKFEVPCGETTEADHWRDVVMKEAELSERRNVLLIVNPASGSNQGLRVFKTVVEPMLLTANVDLTVVVTEKPRKIMSDIREMDSLLNFDVLAVCGGDGLAHEVVNGLLTRPDWAKASKIPIALIPTGSSNKLAKLHKICDPYLATLSILHGAPEPADVLAMTTYSGLRIFSTGQVSCDLSPPSIVAAVNSSPVGWIRSWLNWGKSEEPRHQHRLRYLLKDDDTPRQTVEPSQSPAASTASPILSRRRLVLGPPLMYCPLSNQSELVEDEKAAWSTVQLHPTSPITASLGSPGRMMLSTARTRSEVEISFPSQNDFPGTTIIKSTQAFIIETEYTPTTVSLASKLVSSSEHNRVPWASSPSPAASGRNAFAASCAPTTARRARNSSAADRGRLVVDGEPTDPGPFSVEVLRGMITLLHPPSAFAAVTERVVLARDHARRSEEALQRKRRKEDFRRRASSLGSLDGSVWDAVVRSSAGGGDGGGYQREATEESDRRLTWNGNGRGPSFLAASAVVGVVVVAVGLVRWRVAA